MKEVSISSSWKPIRAHAVTALVTLALAMVLFGERIGARRRPVVAQIPGLSRELSPPPPQPIAPSTSTAPATNEKTRAQTEPPPAPEDVLKDFDPDERTNIRVYAAANKAVVNITTEAEGLGFFGDETSIGSGSGFVIDKQGHVLTNFHVVQGANSVRVTLYDGSAHEAEAIGVDASNDVAVLQIRVPAEKLVPLALGDSSKVMVGQKILALGNPFGLERTLTTGIISSLERSIKAKNGRVIRGIIQTDAAINPGNSGGPLLNTRGEVIGMNTAIVSQVGQSAGISFATPINPIARILPQLIQYGKVIRADLGITRVYATGQGLLVMAIADDGPAERAGIQPIRVKVERLGQGYIRQRLDPDSADLIVAIEHKRVLTLDELLTEVEKHRPGETIRVTVVRDGRPMDIQVRLGQS
jgi:S1-C subfamily serine protease